MIDYLSIAGIGGCYFDASDQGEQPDLKKLLSEVSTQRFRRIDRFTQLALLGACRCVGETALNENTALYLASGTGPAGNNIKLQRQSFRDHELPSPVQFINAVTNSASFYVMKEHGLCGQNLFVSRHQHAFEAALELAANDLEFGYTDCALVGIVDELTHPLEHQYRRSGLSRDLKLGEGSYWLLLTRYRAGSRMGSLRCPGIFDSETSAFKFIQDHFQGRSVVPAVYLNRVPIDKWRSMLGQLFGEFQSVRTVEGEWDGQTVGVLAEFLNPDRANYKDSDSEDVAEELLLVTGDSESRVQVLAVKNTADQDVSSPF